MQLQHAGEDEESSCSLEDDDDEEMVDAPVADAATISPGESEGLHARSEPGGRRPVQVHLKVRAGALRTYLGPQPQSVHGISSSLVEPP